MERVVRDKIREAYSGKAFTLYGCLVGNVGEVVARLGYRVALNEGTEDLL
jgi:hypothetical protein